MGRPRFTPSELERAVRVADKLGRWVEIDRGVIRIVAAQPVAALPSDDRPEDEDQCDAAFGIARP